MIEAQEQFSLKKEIGRKSFHLGLLLLPLMYYQFGKWTSLAVLAPIVTLLFIVDYYRKTNETLQKFFQKFFKVLLRPQEMSAEKLCGATWAGIAACLIFLVCKEPIVITSFVILAICDSMAAIVGKSVVSQPFFEKSRAGSIAFYVSGLAVLFVCGAMFDAKLWFYIFAFFSLFMATAIEARPSFFNLDDNFTIPISFAVLMTAFDWMWGIV